MAKPKSQPGGAKLTDYIHVYALPELKQLVGEAADRADIAMSEWVVRALAEKLGRPDLAIVPRKKPGRRRKVTETAQAS